VDDRERAPDGHNHVGNGALARAAARNGSNGADPVLEEMVSSWRRRVTGAPADEEAGADESPVARGRAEVPGPPFAHDPADVNRVPFIPQQPQPQSPPRHQDETAQHIPSGSDQAAQQQAESDEGEEPPRRADRHSYDERGRYQRPFRFRRSEDGPQHGRAEAQFGPAESGPPEYRPPEYRPPEQRRPWQPEHRNTGPEFGHSPAHGVAPRSPAPFAAPDAPVPPVSSAPPAGGSPTPPYGVVPQSQAAGDPAPPFGPAPQGGPAQPYGAAPQAAGNAAPSYGVAPQLDPAAFRPESAPSGDPGAPPPSPPFGSFQVAPGIPFVAPPPVQLPPPVDPYASHQFGQFAQPPAAPEPTTAFGGQPGQPGQAHPPTTSFGGSVYPPPAYRPAPGEPTTAFGNPAEPTTAFGGQAAANPAAPGSQPHAGPVPLGPVPARPTSGPPAGAGPPPLPTNPFRPVHRNDGSHGATIDPPRFGARSGRSIRPTSSPPAAPEAPPPAAQQQAAPQPVAPQPVAPPPVAPPPVVQQPTSPEAPPVVPAPLIPPPYQTAEAAAPVVPAPLIPPVSPAPDPRWSGGPWSDGAWAAGTSPSVGWQAGPAAPTSPAYPAAPYPPARPVDGPLPPPPPPIPSSGAFDGPVDTPSALDLPQRVPSAPDVPVVPGLEALEGGPDEPPADLSRIADYFRNEEPAEERRDGFDFPAVIEAVQGVVGVREAEIVNLDGRHTLRLDLSDDADPAEVSRAVARLLKEQMGVSAEPTGTLPAAEEPDAMPVPRPVPGPVPGPVEQNSSAEQRRAPNAAPASAGGRVDRAERAAVESVPAVVAENHTVTRDSTPTEPPELTEQTGMAEPAELAPASDPVPARFADLPRVGEPPTSSDSVRVGTVPGRPGLPSPRAGRPSDERPLRARLADIEPDLSFESWLEAIRPGGTRSAQDDDGGPEQNDQPHQSEPAAQAEAEAPERETERETEPETEPAAPADQHHSLVGMPMAPVFTDPTESAPATEPVEPATDPFGEVEARRALEPVSVHREAVPELGLPNAPAFQFAGSGGRVRLEQVEVNSHGLDAEVQVRLSAGGTGAVGHAVGPAVDGYMLRLSATATAGALDALLTDPDSGTRIGRCYIEHATVFPLGTCEIALVVMLIVSGGFAEQLSGSAIVAGDVRQAVVRATLAAANRRLDALLP
jgi:hypothetical protein